MRNTNKDRRFGAGRGTTSTRPRSTSQYTGHSALDTRMTRGQFGKAVGLGAAGVVGAAMMGSGVASAFNDQDPQNLIAGKYISNFGQTTDSGGDIFWEGYLMTLLADGTAFMYTSQLQTGILGGAEVKTQKMGSWVWYDQAQTKIRVMLYDMYLSDYSGLQGPGHHNHTHAIERWKLGFNEPGYNGDPEYDRETRVFVKSNGTLKQISEVFIGVYGDQAIGEFNPNDIEGTSSGVYFDRAAANHANGFPPFVFKKITNHDKDLKALNAFEYD